MEAFQALRTHLLLTFFDLNFQEFLTEKSIKNISSESGSSVLVVKVMDGHFDDSSWWRSSSDEQEESRLHHFGLLDLVGGKEAACLQPYRSGRVWQDFILDSLPPKLRKKRERSKKYKEVCFLR